MDGHVSHLLLGVLHPLGITRCLSSHTHSAFILRAMHRRTKTRITAERRQDDEPPSAAAPSNKNQRRRAQVRRAQIQHRQRKANYVKQLEMDVVAIRDMIAAAQRETQALLAENQALRAWAQQAVTHAATPLSLDQRLSLLNGLRPPPQLSSETGPHLQREVEDVTLTLGFDEVMNAPCYYISSPPPSSSSTSRSTRASPQQRIPASETTAPADPFLPELTPAQTHQAINFILA